MRWSEVRTEGKDATWFDWFGFGIETYLCRTRTLLERPYNLASWPDSTTAGRHCCHVVGENFSVPSCLLRLGKLLPRINHARYHFLGGKDWTPNASKRQPLHVISHTPYPIPHLNAPSARGDSTTPRTKDLNHTILSFLLMAILLYFSINGVPIPSIVEKNVCQFLIYCAVKILFN